MVLTFEWKRSEGAPNMFLHHAPPLRLNEPPPVKYNCTKQEFQTLVRIFFGIGVVAYIFILLILLIFNIFSNLAPALVLSLFIAGFGTGWAGFKTIQKLGKMKDTKSAKYVYQLVESYKIKFGFGNKSIIRRTGRWSVSR
jgi:conjugative transfer region protein (TIGR03750 family)